MPHTAMGQIPNLYTEAYEDLFAWIVSCDYRGYDPYDAMNTHVGWLMRNGRLRLLQTYLHKFSPLNLRPVFGVKPSLDTQGLCIIAAALLVRPPALSPGNFFRMTRDLVLTRSLIAKYGYHCWNGHPFPIQMRDHYQALDVPGIIGTAACGNFLIDYFQHIEAEPALLDVVFSIRNFFLKVLYRETASAAFFKYKPITPDCSCTYNASIVAARFVARANRALGLEEFEGRVYKAVEFLLERQRSDGAWAYGVDIQSGREREQIDFHQGYVLDALLDLMQSDSCPNGLREWIGDAYQKGLMFFRQRQFLANGAGLYRVPRRWPISIINQAQGIITFVRADELDGQSLNFARIIADWTLCHMRDRSGYFYYFRYPALINRIPYMRWNQAPMLYALALLASAREKHLRSDVKTPASRMPQQASAL